MINIKKHKSDATSSVIILVTRYSRIQSIIPENVISKWRLRNIGVHNRVIVYHVTKDCIAKKWFCQKNQIKCGQILSGDDVSFCGEL